MVEAGAMVKECVVADGVRVPADTSWHGVILRIADGRLAPGERRIGELAVCGVDSPRAAVSQSGPGGPPPDAAADGG
ncbi:hypothetical protein D3C83_57910 [compost metagenome]